jgi:hypothetical protein
LANEVGYETGRNENCKNAYPNPLLTGELCALKPSCELLPLLTAEGFFQPDFKRPPLLFADFCRCSLFI